MNDESLKELKKHIYRQYRDDDVVARRVVEWSLSKYLPLIQENFAYMKNKLRDAFYMSSNIIFNANKRVSFIHVICLNKREKIE